MCIVHDSMKIPVTCRRCLLFCSLKYFTFILVTVHFVISDFYLFHVLRFIRILSFSTIREQFYQNLKISTFIQGSTVISSVRTLNEKKNHRTRIQNTHNFFGKYFTPGREREYRILLEVVDLLLSLFLS